MFFFRRRMKLYGNRKSRVNVAIIKEVLSFLSVTIVAVCAGILLVLAFGSRTKVIGDSMEPELYHGQSVLIDKARYLLSSPKVGSVIVFVPNGNTASHDYIKRVVALPGDRVQITNNELFINGVKAFPSSDGYDLLEEAGIAQNEILLGTDEFFVLGDNRNSSEDSRSANIGPVKKEQIIGAAYFKYGAPGNGAGFIK